MLDDYFIKIMVLCAMRQLINLDKRQQENTDRVCKLVRLYNLNKFSAYYALLMNRF